MDHNCTKQVAEEVRQIRDAFENFRLEEVSRRLTALAEALEGDS